MTQEKQRDVQLVPREKPEHQHTYRVGVGPVSVIRFCETCGKAWVLDDFHNVLHWKKIAEPQS